MRLIFSPGVLFIKSFKMMCVKVLNILVSIFFKVDACNSNAGHLQIENHLMSPILSFLYQTL